MTADFYSQQYKDFLYELHCTTCIDLRILDNLIKLQLIDFILVDPKAIQISSNGFFLNKDNIQLKENYTQLPEFIFASYPLYNPNFNVSLHKSITDQYSYYLTNYNFGNPTYLHFIRNKFSNAIYIDVFFNINLNYFSNDVKILSEEEKEDFYFFIKNNLRNEVRNAIYVNYLNSKKYYFLRKTAETIEKYQYTDIDNLIKLKEVKFLHSCQLIKQFEKIKINKFFEKALLRKEMNNF